jgi:hypothetical protein
MFLETRSKRQHFSVKQRRLARERLENRSLPSEIEGLSQYFRFYVLRSATTNVAALDVASQYSISLRSTVQSGVPVSVQLVALNVYGSIVRSYSGTADIATSDSAATIPSSVTFHNGIANFQTTFNTIGTQTVTATDGSGVASKAAAATHVVASLAPTLPPSNTPAPASVPTRKPSSTSTF